MRMAKKFLSCVMVLALLQGCGNSAGGGAASAVTGGGGGNTPATDTRFAMAHGCFVMKADGGYVQRNGTNYSAAGGSAAGAESFYLQPAGLGRYVFYTRDTRWMTGSGSAVSAATAPADGSDWTVEGSNGVFTAQSLGQPLSVNTSKALVLGGTPARVEFESVAAELCSIYPEMPVGVEGAIFKNSNVNNPVIGFAEVHAHMSMGSDMSDGSGNRGPSAGGVMYGHAVNRFGVVEALKDCSVMHGPNGTTSPEAIILDQNPTDTHNTVGWPSFIGWPKRDSQLHQQMYYRWLERAYRAGLRTMTVHGTSIEALCNIAKSTVGDASADCTDMGVGMKQVEYLYDMQNYIDAQNGGPGKGWFRIIKDPAEARSVIADGKLAVIPGLEFSNLFRCRVQFLPDGGETSDCTRADIDQQIEEAWELGVRQVFPYHDVDSALGGTGIFSSVLNYVGFTDTRGFWQTYPCENGGEGPTYFYNAGAVMETAPISMFNDPISSAIIGAAAGGTVPVYGPGRQCNARTVTDLGQYALDRIMRKGFIVDIDHAEIRSKQIMLDLGARVTPAYPMISGHGGHGGINNAQATQIIRQGGIIYPAIPNGQGYKAFLEKMKPIWAASGTPRPLSIGYGADANGLANLPTPRGADRTPVTYPFTLFSGAGWGPQFANAGITPVRVDQLAIPGGQSWDINELGMAHYGLVADIVEEIRIEGGEEATTSFYRSAETFLQLWEQTQRASAEYRRLTPVP